MKFTCNFTSLSECQNIVGNDNINLKFIEKLFDVKLNVNFNEIECSTDDETTIDLIKKMFEMLSFMVQNNFQVTSRDITYIYKNLDNIESLYKIYQKKK